MATITINDQDPSIRYLGSWKEGLNSTAFGTPIPGDRAVYVFKGSSISVFGTISAGVGRGATSHYIIDGSPPEFIYEAQPQDVIPLFDQEFYKSHPLDPSKEHTLVITLMKTGGNAFWIDYLKVVTGGSADIPGTNSTQGETPTNSSPPTPSTASGIVVPPANSSPIPPQPSTATSDGVVPPTQLPITSSTTISPIRPPTQPPTTIPVNPSPGGLSRNAVVGIAVGSVIIGLLIIAITILVFIRRRNRKIDEVVQSYRVTAFTGRSSTGHQGHTPQSRNPGRYPRQNGYVVRGGLSVEKTANNAALSVEREEGGIQGTPDVLPTYDTAIIGN